jgi:D-amino-acid dehydrogenase
MSHVLVVGGGVIGAACASALLDDGHRVTVIDRGHFGQGCSHGNCGFICPSHVLPLAEPGAVWRALKTLVQPNSPFRIKPRLDFSLLSWMIQFAGRCNRRDMLQSGFACQALLDWSMTLYRELMEQESLDCDWQTKGLLFPYKSPRAFEEYAATDALLRETFHHPAVRLSGDEVVELEPALQSGLAGGWYYESDAHLRPDRLMAALKSRLQSRGATLVESCPVKGLISREETVVAVSTTQGECPADQFVVATGAWSPEFAGMLGCRIPIQPGKGYSLTMPRPAACPAIPMIFPETRVAVTPWASGYRLGSTMEFAGYDRSLPANRLDLLRRGAEPYLKEPYTEPVEEQWFGWRPMTYDSVPIIGFVPQRNNVLLATGHSMLGVSMAPGTGRLVADLLAGRTPPIDPRPYRVTRFSEQGG